MSQYLHTGGTGIYVVQCVRLGAIVFFYLYQGAPDLCVCVCVDTRSFIIEKFSLNIT